jgi:hypothetical protein
MKVEVYIMRTIEVGSSVSVINKGLVGIVVGFDVAEDQFGHPFEKPIVHITLKLGNKRQCKKPVVLDYTESFNPAGLQVNQLCLIS